MPTTIATIRARIRKDLKDPDSDRWSDDDLDRHIEHAVQDLNLAAPLQAKDEALTFPDPASREVDISGVTGLIHVKAVEYPVGEFPKRYRHFNVFSQVLEVQVPIIPTAGDSLYLYYDKVHTVDSEGSTLPAELEDICAIGAEGYAAMEWAAYSVNKVNIGGKPTPTEFMAWGKDRLERFRDELKRLRRRKARWGRFYTEDST